MSDKTVSTVGEKHLFAVYISAVELRANALCILDDSAVFHRIVRVLRLNKHDVLILFNVQQHAHVIIQEINASAHKIIVRVETVESNEQYKPSIIAYIPLLKKEALEEALYAAVEVGIQQVVLYHSAKTYRITLLEHEYRRIQLVVIAAAEQSKNYALPDIKHIAIPLNACIENAENQLFLIAHPSGNSLYDVVTPIRQQTHKIGLFVGPEGDFTESELALLKSVRNAQLVKLTPTILRAPQAVAVFAGSIRSLLL